MTTSFILQSFDLDSVEISHQAHRLFQQPFLAVVPELINNNLDRSKVTFPIIEANSHPSVSKPDDICASITRQVNWEAGMLLNSPPTSVVAEVVNDLLFRLERAVTVVDCDIHTTVCKPNYISSLITCEIGDESRMFLDTPPA